MKKWGLIGLIVGFFVMFVWNLNLVKSNSDLKEDAGKRYERLAMNHYSVVTGTLSLNFEELAKTEDGKRIIADNASAFDRLQTEYTWNENILWRLYGITNDIASLEWTIYENGEWTPEEKERHQKALRTLHMISIDLSSVEGTSKYWYQLFTEEDSVLIEKIEQRAKAQEYEL